MHPGKWNAPNNCPTQKNGSDIDKVKIRKMNMKRLGRINDVNYAFQIFSDSRCYLQVFSNRSLNNTSSIGTEIGIYIPWCFVEFNDEIYVKNRLCKTVSLRTTVQEFIA